ncbi:MAG: hypothetical protein JJLCMIEE_01641 [Acidimicrobiales bacterium]|nr:MAG: hypothetical protein EDR02_05055 [Actinomycetota bacterium]MBV6508577.1 hypothetical protein [Acidimicrobiales bacterium]RIK05116.1 MAG: hypothetical protein DCC48_10855 [Acidobacteriota bacterium]
MRKLLLTMLAAVMTLSGCSTDSAEDAGDDSAAGSSTSSTFGFPDVTDTSDAATGTTAVQPPEPAPAPTCDPAKPAEPGQTTETTSFNGRDRTYLLTVPESYDGVEAVPLVFDYHGLSSTAQQQEAYTGLATAAAEAGAVTVTPDGVSGNWGFYPGIGEDDMAFTEALVATVSEQLCIDANRVYAAGFSTGSIMAGFVGCELGDTFAAVAHVSSLLPPDFCVTEPGATSLIVFHGTADPIAAYEGGSVPGAPAFVKSPAVEEGIAAWAAVSGCDPDPGEEVVNEEVRHLTYTGCTDSHTVEAYFVQDGGHTWPGAEPAAAAPGEDAAGVPAQQQAGATGLGYTTQAVDASLLIIDFFLAHPRPGE